MTGLATRLAHGVVAGAVGTVALNATTYLDMAVRGRPASSTPEQTVARLAGRLHVPLPADGDQAASRLTGVGALLGMLAGVSVGAAMGAVRPYAGSDGIATTTGIAGALAMLAGNGPMTLLGVTDPRTWTAADWAADLVPHAAYAAAAAATWHALES